MEALATTEAFMTHPAPIGAPSRRLQTAPAPLPQSPVAATFNAPPDRLLTLADVETITSHKKSYLYLLIRQGRFPKPIRTGVKSSRWSQNAVMAWVHSLTTAGEQAGQK
jgi:prophage regulatory protein